LCNLKAGNKPQSTTPTQKQPDDETTFTNKNAAKIVTEKNKSTDFAIKEYNNNPVKKVFYQ
jgi:hypothetical protein